MPGSTLATRWLLFLSLAVLSIPAAAQEDVFSLDGLVVTTSPTSRAAELVAAHVTVLDGETLRGLGLTSVSEALRRVAGLHVASNGSFGATTSLFTRGGESDYTLVLLDGVQLNQPGGGFDFAHLDLSQVERIEVVRGPSSALHGSEAVAGVVHVVTRTGRGSASAVASTRVGSYGRADLGVSAEGAGAERAAPHQAMLPARASGRSHSRPHRW